MPSEDKRPRDYCIVWANGDDPSFLTAKELGETEGFDLAGWVEFYLMLRGKRFAAMTFHGAGGERIETKVFPKPTSFDPRRYRYDLIV